MSDKYQEIKNNPLYSSLDLSETEFNEFLPYIEQMMKKNTTDEYIPNLIRIRGQIVLEYIKNPNVDKTIIIKKNYLYYDENVFNEEDFKIRLSEEFFDKSKNDLKEAINFFLDFKNEKVTHGIYLWGGCGLGKTRLNIALANELSLKDKTIGFVSVFKLSRVVKTNISDETLEKNKNDVLLNLLQNVDILFIDDIGGESTKSPWFYSEILFSIFDFRMNKKKPTFFTSNLSLSMFLQQKLFPVMKSDKTSQNRFIERIRALVGNKIIEVKGTSRRY